MSMNKIIYKIMNKLESIGQLIISDVPTGLLHHKKDSRDRKFLGKKDSFIGVGTSIDDKDFSLAKNQFDQNPFTMCVFAAGTKGSSDQDGIKYSVRWSVKVARHLGYTSGQGYSYLRGFLKVATQVGLLPYRLMPDEVNGMSWNEYSKWTAEDEKLLKTALNYRLKEYKSVNNRKDLMLALKNGYAPFTGGKWFSEMNRPQSPGYLLQYLGRYVGGHSYRYTGWSYSGQYMESLNTFGENYGLEGKMWLSNPFKITMQYSIYLISKLDLDKRVAEFKIENDGKMVRTKNDPACYLIEGGRKRHIPTMEIFWNVYDKIGAKNFDNDVKPELLNNVKKGSDVLTF